MTTGRTWAAALLLHLVSSAGALARPDRAQPVRDNRLTTADRIAVRVEHFTGPVDRHCGIYLLASAEAPVARGDVTTAVRCLDQAKRRGQSSWALWQTGSGIEGPTFAGIASSPVSDPHLVSGGVGAGLHVTLEPCLRPRVQKDATIACRNHGGALTLREVTEAVEALERDVVRTLGDDLGRVVSAAHARVAAGADVSNAGFLPAIVDDVQRVIDESTDGPWPVCPIHHDHSLDHRDRHWLCQKDGAFIAALGSLPRRPRSRR